MTFREINTTYDMNTLMNDFGRFHDSCIKEIVYISGGFVNEKGAMNPFDSLKSVIIVFQSQDAKYQNIEIKFDGVVQMNLVPKPDDYDNIIYEASLIRENELYYWAEWGDFRITDSNNYTGTWISAKKISWRALEQPVGNRPIYYPLNYLPKNE